MQVDAVHHASIATKDLERSLAFYRDVLGLRPGPRPDFPNVGAWLDLGATQVHLIVHPEGTFRTSGEVDNDDCHFVLRPEDFDEVRDHLNRNGYAEDAPEGSGNRLLVKRHGLAGFPQAYALDPDRHVVEIKGAG